MEVTFYGVRGSVPTPLTADQVFAKVRDVAAEVLAKALSGRLRSPDELPAFLGSLGFGRTCFFGGNTPCVEVVATDGSGDRLVLDAGSGIRPLGAELMKGPLGQGRGHLDILFSHFHYDHIQGLPFFAPLFVPGNRIRFHGGVPDILGILAGQFRAPYFPVEWEQLASEREGKTLEEGRTEEIAGFRVRIHGQKHPNRSFAYRIERQGKVLVYATDSELIDLSVEELEAYRDFFSGADCIIADTQYAIIEAATSKRGWGHSPYNIDIDLAAAAGARSMYFFHYDPAATDADIEAAYREALEYLRTMHPASRMKVGLSREGLKVRL